MFLLQFWTLKENEQIHISCLIFLNIIKKWPYFWSLSMNNVISSVETFNTYHSSSDSAWKRKTENPSLLWPFLVGVSFLIKYQFNVKRRPFWRWPKWVQHQMKLRNSKYWGKITAVALIANDHRKFNFLQGKNIAQEWHQHIIYVIFDPQVTLATS